MRILDTAPLKHEGDIFCVCLSVNELEKVHKKIGQGFYAIIPSTMNFSAHDFELVLVLSYLVLNVIITQCKIRLLLVVCFFSFFHEWRERLKVNTSHRYIYGIGGVARELADILGTHMTIAGFVIDREYISSSPKEIMNIPVIPFDDYSSRLNDSNNSITISLGEPVYRKMLSEKLMSLGLREAGINLGEYLASDSYAGAGSILHIGAIVSSNCSIGRSCLINKNVVIEHDNSVGDYCVFCPNAVTGGHVSIGNNCFVGLGACIRDKVKIGNDVIIGMGAVVTHDI